MEIKKELIDKLLDKDFQSDNLDDMWVVMIEDKIFAPKTGAMFHFSMEQAWKHFYNEYHWKVKGKYKTDKYGYDYWRISNQITESDTQIWNAFKSELYQNYNFRIIQWKDAKRYVCGETRTEGDC